MAGLFFASCENSNGINPNYNQVEKLIFGTWRLSQYVDDLGKRETETIEVLYTFEKGEGYHNFFYTVTENGEIAIYKKEFEIEPMSDNEVDDVVIYFPNDPTEQYLITQISASSMRWQTVSNHNPKTKSEEGYIFTRAQ